MGSPRQLSNVHVHPQQVPGSNQAHDALLRADVRGGRSHKMANTFVQVLKKVEGQCHDIVVCFISLEIHLTNKML